MHDLFDQFRPVLTAISAAGRDSLRRRLGRSAEVGVEGDIDARLLLLRGLLVELFDGHADVVGRDIDLSCLDDRLASARARAFGPRNGASAWPAIPCAAAPRAPRRQPDGKRLGKVLVGCFCAYQPSM